MKRKKRKQRVFEVRPWSISPCPTPDDLRAAWFNRRRSNRDFIWLLSVLGELTCYTDCNLEHLGGFGNIAGRRGGLKAYLEEHVPDLVPKYKSISRHATLSYRLRKAFDYYPPAALSLMHPDLPLPRRNLLYITNFARKVYREHFADVSPTYVAFNAVVIKRLKVHHPKFRWGPALPRDKWAEAERRWTLICVRPKAFEAINAQHSFFARDYNLLKGGEK